MPYAMNYTEVRNKLASVMDKVCDDRETVIITRQKAPSVVMLSLDDYNGIMETAHLLSRRSNAERLRASIAEAESGRVEEHGLIEE